MILLVSTALAFAMALTGQSSEEVVLLPGPDGKVGVVVVERNGTRHVLDQAYESSRSSDADVVQRDAASVRASFAPALRSLPARPTVFRLYFESGTDELTPGSRAELERMLAEMRKRPIPDISVVAHTDTVGDGASNDALSAQRAERVKKFLIGIGIQAARIQTAGRGERELLVPTADDIDEPRNRRVEVSVR